MERMISDLHVEIDLAFGWELQSHVADHNECNSLMVSTQIAQHAPAVGWKPMTVVLAAVDVEEPVMELVLALVGKHSFYPYACLVVIGLVVGSTCDGGFGTQRSC